MAVDAIAMFGRRPSDAVARSEPRVLYYGLGGGFGHAVRTIAVARQCRRRWGGHHVLLVNTEFASCLRGECEAEQLDLQVLSASLDRNSLRQRIDQVCHVHRPHLWVVDTFPRGIVGELAAIFPRYASVSKCLIHRQLPARYIRDCQLAEFARHYYQLLLAPGETGGLETACDVRRVPPMVIRNWDELTERSVAQARMRVPAEQRVVLVVGNGTGREAAAWVQLASWFASRPWWNSSWALRVGVPWPAEFTDGLSTEHLVHHFPLVEYLPGVDFVIGQAGYNLCWETRSVEVPALLVAQPRRYDRQHSRTPWDMRTGNRERWAEVLQQQMRLPRQPRTAPRYVNGAEVAAEHMARMLEI